MLVKVIFTLVCMVGIIWSKKAHDTQSLWLTLALSLGILLIIFPIPGVPVVGSLVYGVALLAVMLYGLLASGMDRDQRVVILLCVVPLLVYWIFSIAHWPGAGKMRLLTIVPLITFVWGLFKGVKMPFGYLVILLADAIYIAAQGVKILIT